MRKILSAALILGLACSANALPRLTVRDFTDKSEGGKAPAAAIMNMMITELSKAGVFVLMDRDSETMALTGNEIKMGAEGLIDPSTAIKPGRLQSPQYAMTGAITMYYYSEKGSGFAIPILGSATRAKTAYVMIDLRITDLETGGIIYASNELGESNKQIDKGAIAAYKGFFVGSYKRESGGILAMATRNAVEKHVAAIKAIDWERR
ncbi:MAG: hypothetical protein IJS28_04135 [Synergistaceae bacterium]|nr:hypothetical protein [Synergistaceae bacterium]